MRAAVIGSGAWGTALALCLHRNGHETALWFRTPEKAAEIHATRLNPRLSTVKLPEDLTITSDYACAAGCQLVVLAPPSSHFRSVCRSIAPHLDETAILATATKGVEPGSLLRMSQIAQEETGRPVVVLTGPSHAVEVAQGVPTGCVAACEDRACAEFVQDAFMSDTFRVYSCPDPVGAELGGALKNVIALCAGICDGLGCGDNTKAMLMTRGMTEMARLGLSLGAHKETFTGLTGIGDLIVTCTSMHSRNRRAGILIGQGKTPQEAMAEVGAVVEGYYAARSAWELCRKQGVEMPILQAAYSVLYEDAPVGPAFQSLLLRRRKAESEDNGWL